MGESKIKMMAEDMLSACDKLRQMGRYDEIISWVVGNIEQLPAAYRARAWFEAFNAARAKGDTEKAKRFILAIDQADPKALRGLGR